MDKSSSKFIFVSVLAYYEFEWKPSGDLSKLAMSGPVTSNICLLLVYFNSGLSIFSYRSIARIRLYILYSQLRARPDQWDGSKSANGRHQKKLDPTEKLNTGFQFNIRLLL